MADDLKYGYKGAEPTQSFGNNTGVFDSNDINNLIADNKWTTFGQLELIETQTVTSAVLSVDFINLENNPYNVYFFTVSNLQTSAASQAILRFSNNNGSSFISSGYQYAYMRGSIGGSTSESKNTNHPQINTGLLSDTATGMSANGYFYLYNMLDSSKYSFANLHNFASYSADGGRYNFGSGVLPTAETHNAFQIEASAGNITDATISLYGIRYS